MHLSVDHDDTVSRRYTRFSGRANASAADARSESRRDRDRVLYSDSWRRLAGVTQVITPFEDRGLIHNRLTHSEKVAQVARSLAENLLADESQHRRLAALGGLDADVVEAAALAHDLGHPPFGHIGEMTLDRLARERLGLEDGFEGNAQTMRALLVTEKRHARYDGLDLMPATIAAVAKYPWPRPTHRGEDHEAALEADAVYRLQWKKFSAYREEWPVLEAAREFFDASAFGATTQTLEASLMDTADDITYAVHDFEDFYRAGVLDVPGVLRELETYNRGQVDAAVLKQLEQSLRRDFPAHFSEESFDDAIANLSGKLRTGLRPGFRGDPDQIADIGQLSSWLIGRYVSAVVLGDHPIWPNGPLATLENQQWHEIQVLKAITRSLVIERPDVAVMQRGQQRLLEELVDELVQWKDNEKDFRRLPRRLRHEIELARRETRDGPAAEPMPVAARYQKPDHGAPTPPRGHENRCVIDFVCSLTDGQCVALTEKLTGRRLTGGLTDAIH